MSGKFGTYGSVTGSQKEIQKWYRRMGSRVFGLLNIYREASFLGEKLSVICVDAKKREL